MKSLITVLMGLVAVILISDGRGRIEGLIAQRDLNPFELKGSPYGEIIGAALQEPVHLLSHGGIGHDHVSDAEGCVICSPIEVEAMGVHGHDHDHSHELFTSHRDGPLLQKLKSKLASLESMIRQNHNPQTNRSAVRKYERKRIRELMALAYEMDPTNYANFSIYCGFESSTGGLKRVIELAEISLSRCEGKLSDPNDALTAVAAAEMILIYREFYTRRVGEENPQLEKDYDFFVDKTEVYAQVFDQALADGRLEQFSQEKVDEMIEFYARFNYTISAYKKLVLERRGDL